MDVVGSSQDSVFIACKDADKIEGSGSKRVYFVDEEAFKFVRDYVEVYSIVPNEQYWESNKHDKIVNVLSKVGGFDRRHISNSLCALGL